MQIKIFIEKTTDGFSAYAENYSVFTVGNDMKEITANILEALNLYFEDKGQVIGLPDIELVNVSTESTSCK